MKVIKIIEGVLYCVTGCAKGISVTHVLPAKSRQDAIDKFINQIVGETV